MTDLKKEVYTGLFVEKTQTISNLQSILDRMLEPSQGHDSVGRNSKTESKVEAAFESMF